MRKAMKNDFKIGNVLHDIYGAWTITRHYDEGIWEARGKSGLKTIFEDEANFYKIKK